MPVLTFVGLPLRAANQLFNAAVAIQSGEIIGVVPKMYLPNYREYQELTGGNPARYDGFERIDRAYLAEVLRPAFEFRRERPETFLWCGEFGTIRHCRLEYRENWMSDLISLLEEHEIPWCAWNYLSTPNDGNRFSLVDDDTREILSPRLAGILRGESARR